MVVSDVSRNAKRAALSLVVLLAMPVLGKNAPDTDRSRVTSDSIKYLDKDGEISFAPSREELPEAYRLPRYWSDAGWCADSPAAGEVEQTIELADIDADGESEVLVFFDDECPNGRRFAILEVIEANDHDDFSIVATVRAQRGWKPELLDLDADGKFELLGRYWGAAPEFWVRQDGEYVDLVQHGGACFDIFWREATVKPGKPLKETLARVLERYHEGECRRTP